MPLLFLQPQKSEPSHAVNTDSPPSHLTHAVNNQTISFPLPRCRHQKLLAVDLEKLIPATVQSQSAKHHLLSLISDQDRGLKTQQDSPKPSSKPSIVKASETLPSLKPSTPSSRPSHGFVLYSGCDHLRVVFGQPRHCCSFWWTHFGKVPQGAIWL